MLHYLGPQLGGAGPVASVLPPAMPGSIPAGVPGAPSAAAPAPPVNVHAPHPAIHPHGAAPHPIHALAAILRHAAGGAGHSGPPPLPEYGTTTQSNGSVLLHVKNPDGSLGPVVKVIPPIKTGAPAGGQPG